MEYKYTAFISYSNKNLQKAARLKRQLQRFRLPTFMAAEREFKHPLIFMADKDFNEHRVLAGLHKKLDESEYLIVVCSPESAASPYCEEEVSYFIRTGRADKIIPYIISGHANSGNPETECYPESLRNMPREEQISGIFIPTVGPYKGYLMTVSRILNVEYNSITVLDRERKMKRTAVLAACFLVLVGIGVRAAIYYLPHYEFYTDYVDKNGVPEGILRLDKDARLHRPAHYKFEYRKNKLVRVSLENSYGYPADHNNTEMLDRPCIKEFQYNNRGGIEVVCKNSKERVLWVETISPNRLFVGLKDYDTDFGTPVMRSLSDMSSNAGDQMVGFSFRTIRNASKSTIFGYALERDEDGYILKKMFSSSSDNTVHPGHDANGIEGLEYGLDSLHRIVRITYLNKDGIPVNDHNGVSSKKYYYDGSGNLNRVECLDLAGEPSCNENFWAVAVDEFNEYGQVVRERTYDENGRLSLDKSGVAMRTYKFNSRGLMTECASYDDKESPVNTRAAIVNMPVAHRYVYQYDKNGLMTELRLYDEDDRLIKIGETACMTFEYDKNRNVTRQVCRDENGDITYGSGAIAIVSTAYEDNLPISEIYCDRTGKATNTTYGFSSVFRVYDKGRLVREEYFDKRGARVRVQQLNYACGVVIQYDKQNGNISKVTFIGENGSPSRNAQGQEIVTSTFNSQGLCSEEINRTASGELLYYIKNEFDEKGNQIKESYYDENGRLSMQPDLGYASIESRFNEIGQLVEQRCYDAYGELTLNKQGWAIVRLGYKKGQSSPFTMSYFGPDGSPVVSGQGCHRLRILTERGLTSETASYGVDDKPMTNEKTGAWKQVFAYTPMGLPVSITLYDLNDQRVNGIDGFCECRYEYDSRGAMTAWRNLDASGRLRNNLSQGIACQQAEYLYNGLQTKVASYDENGRPTDGTVGFHSVERLYDSHLNLYRQECRNAHGDLTRYPKWGYSRTEFAFNSKDVCIYQATIYDSSCSVIERWLVLDTLGYPKFAIQDSLGNVFFSDGTRAYEPDNTHDRNLKDVIEERIQSYKKRYSEAEGVPSLYD